MFLFILHIHPIFIIHKYLITITSLPRVCTYFYKTQNLVLLLRTQILTQDSWNFIETVGIPDSLLRNTHITIFYHDFHENDSLTTYKRKNRMVGNKTSFANKIHAWINHNSWGYMKKVITRSIIELGPRFSIRSIAFWSCGCNVYEQRTQSNAACPVILGTKKGDGHNYKNNCHV